MTRIRVSKDKAQGHWYATDGSKIIIANSFSTIQQLLNGKLGMITTSHFAT